MCSFPDMLKQETENWRNKEEVEILENQDHHKQLVATATVLSHFSPTVCNSDLTYLFSLINPFLH